MYLLLAALLAAGDDPIVYRSRTNTCVSFHGSWSKEDALEVLPGSIFTRCEMMEGDSTTAICTVNIGTNVYEFTAERTKDDGFIKFVGESTDGDGTMFEMRCHSRKDCVGFQVWNPKTKLGMRCAKL